MADEVSKWRIGKEIPAVFIIVLALQTLGVAAWFGIVWAKIEDHDKSILALKDQSYTKIEAQRDRELAYLRIEAATAIGTQRYEGIETRLERLQRAVDRINERALK